jgi:hypothetical protein
MGDEPIQQRASERLRAIAGLAVNKDTVRAAFATKLVAVGLALVCFAGGLDYFSHGEEVRRALAGIARDSGQGAIVDDLAKVEGQMSTWKRAALAFLPTTAPQWVVLISTLPGVCLLAWGLRLKLGSGTQAERASALWDLGRIVLGPGVIGAVAYLLASMHGFPVLRRTTSSFVGKVRDGALTSSDVLSLGAKYHGWTWAEVGPVLVLGLLSIVLAIVLGRVSAVLNRPLDRPGDRARTRLGRAESARGRVGPRHAAHDPRRRAAGLLVDRRPGAALLRLRDDDRDRQLRRGAARRHMAVEGAPGDLPAHARAHGPRRRPRVDRSRAQAARCS